jgi:hypothetical protein
MVSPQQQEEAGLTAMAIGLPTDRGADEGITQQADDSVPTAGLDSLNTGMSSSVLGGKHLRIEGKVFDMGMDVESLHRRLLSSEGFSTCTRQRRA